MISWLKEEGKDRDVVVSSRIRLARNFEKYNFPVKISIEEAQSVFNEMAAVIDKSHYAIFKTKDIPKIEKEMLVEKHVISPALLGHPDISGFALSQDETETIMINEEDHLRIQVLDSGLSLNEVWHKINQIDDRIEKNVQYAFDEQLGYLTSCPTNTGTGMRASVMLHLPALEITKQINKVLSTVAQFGLAVRGVYGEGSKTMGSLYQISNQVTLGDTEETIIKKIENITRQIAEKEKNIRNSLMEKNKLEFEDKVFRAYGVLKNARMISTEEAVRLISYLKLGISMDVLKGNTINEMDKLFIEIQPASLQFINRSEMSDIERDIKRAETIRNKLI
jgi:protein arginine kinase